MLPPILFPHSSESPFSVTRNKKCQGGIARNKTVHVNIKCHVRLGARAQAAFIFSGPDPKFQLFSPSRNQLVLNRYFDASNLKGLVSASSASLQSITFVLFS